MNTEAQELQRLHDLLAQRADEAGLLQIAYRTVDSPVGTLLLAATTEGVVRIAFEREGIDAVLERLATTISPRIMAAPRRLDPLAVQLDEYFAHRRKGFDVPLDLSLTTGFRRQVLTHLRTIDYGHTASYADVAAGIDNPKAVRAVGTACATNPLPLVIPCHRVVRSGGGIGQYLGGLDNKQLLLDLESAA